MSWLDNMRGKKRPSDARASEEETPNAGRTVVRATGAPAPTIIKGSTRFKPGDEVGGNLQIKRLLGRGGMGEVYLARQTPWDVDIAVKIPTEQILADPVNRHRIAREAEAWADLGLHRHIAYCHYAQLFDELLLLVIEYVDGGSLREWIAEGRCADLKAGLNLAIQFCHGLEHAHSRGLVHRDIKPENILLTKDGLLKITDFGIVRKALAGIDGTESVGAVPMAVPPGMTMVAIGTDDYMAPEQWGQQQAIDQRADIFALGVCLYEMLCGRRPYMTRTVGQRQEAPEPETLRGDNRLPPRLCSLMKHSVDWDRENRPAGAKQVLAELCAVYEEAFGEASLHAELPEISALADDLNNRALSYVALGRIEDAEKAWQAALEADPLHAESVYNYGLYQWRSAKVTDEELVSRLRAVIQIAPQSWLPGYLLAQVHLERGDCDGAKEELNRIADIDPAREADVIPALQAVDQHPAPSRLVRRFEGHSADSACFSLDGRYVLSGGRDGLNLWDVGSGLCVRKFEGRTSHVNSVCLSADGQYALSSWDKTIKLWGVASGRCLRTIEGHTDAVTSVSLSADGLYGLSGSWGWRDQTLKVWEVASGRHLRTFEGHTDYVTSVDLSADGHYGLSGSWDQTLKLWEVASGRCLRTFEGHTSEVRSVCLSADGQYALSGSRDQTLKLWEVASGRCLRTFEGHTSAVNSVSLSADGRYALSGSRDNTMRLWEVGGGRCLRTFEGHTSAINSVSLSADRQYALSAGEWPDELTLWKMGAFSFAARLRLSQGLRSAEVTATAACYQAAVSEARHAFGVNDILGARRFLKTARGLAGHARAITAIREWGMLYDQLTKCSLQDYWPQWASERCILSVCVSRDGQYALSGGEDKALKLWDVVSGRCLRTLDHFSPVTLVCMSVDGQYALSVTRHSNTLQLWALASGDYLRTFEGHELSVTSVCLSADGNYALSGSSEKTLKLWEVATGRCLRTLEGLDSYVTSVCMSTDGQYALSGTEGQILNLWEVATGRCLRTLEGHTSFISSVCLSPDGRYALSGGSWDRTLKLWDVASGCCLRTFEGHACSVNSVCLSADGQYALSGSSDKTLKLWDVASGRCLRTFEGLSAVVNSVCLSADGRYAFSGANGITAWLLDWDLEENEPADWDEEARPYLDVFLRAHCPYAAKLPQDRQPTEEEVRQALTRRGRPVWTETEFQGFHRTLGCAGLGWLRPEGVRRELGRMAAGSSWE